MRRGMLLCCALLAPACAPAAGPAGRALFDADGCRSCHAIAGVGGNAAPDLAYVGFRHSAKWLDLWLRSPRAWKRGTLMPEFRLAPDDRAAIVAYLSSLKGRDWHPWKPGDGKAIFLQAGCVACHGAQGKGGFPNDNVPGLAIPALTSVGQTYTKEELIRKITEGSKPQKADPSGPEPLVFMPAWGKVLSAREIEDVAAYVLSLSPKNPDADW